MPHQGHQCGTAGLRQHAHWKRPTQGWIKVNVDGSSYGNPGNAGAGGLIRDEDGDWVVGFSAYVGNLKTAFEAELLAIKYGLRLAIIYVESGIKVFNGVMIESDCLMAVNLIFKRDNPPHLPKIPEGPEYDQLLGEIRNLLDRLGCVCDVRMQHIFREGNHCADFLAKQGAHHQDYPLMIWEEPPAKLSAQLAVDRYENPYWILPARTGSFLSI